jgi:hypothetical protein
VDEFDVKAYEDALKRGMLFVASSQDDVDTLRSLNVVNSLASSQLSNGLDSTRLREIIVVAPQSEDLSALRVLFARSHVPIYVAALPPGCESIADFVKKDPPRFKINWAGIIDKRNPLEGPSANDDLDAIAIEQDEAQDAFSKIARGDKEAVDELVAKCKADRAHLSKNDADFKAVVSTPV